MTNNSLYWGAVGIYALLTLWLMCAPRPLPEMPSTSYASGIGHFVIFAGMAGVFSHAMRQTWPECSRMRLFWIPGLSTSIYGMLLETAQYFIPARTFDMTDVLLNIGGAFAMQTLLLKTIWREHKIELQINQTPE